MSKTGNPMVVRKCTCDKCGIEAHTVPETTHRRCPGSSENKDLRDKSNKLPSNERGKWC